MDHDRLDMPCYIARCLCGCGRLVFAVVDDPAYKKDTARSTSEMIRKGYALERSTVGDVRKAEWFCASKDAQMALV